MIYPLSLKIDPSSWRLYSKRRSDPAFQNFQKKVFSRDDNVCQFCGFQSSEYFEVINLDGNYQNNKISNLVTTCCFCAQCHFVDNVGHGDYGGGVLIHAPKISQNQLNSMCHVLFCAIVNNTGYKLSANNIYRNFKFGAISIEEKYGEGTSIPSTLGQLLIESDMKLDEANNSVLKEIRLLPSKGKFAEQITSWAEAALAELEDECSYNSEEETVDSDN